VEKSSIKLYQDNLPAVGELMTNKTGANNAMPCYLVGEMIHKRLPRNKTKTTTKREKNKIIN